MNCPQKSFQIVLRLSEDFREQFESVPIMTDPLSGMLVVIKSDKNPIHYKKSSSFPLVGAYRDITRILFFGEHLKIIPENLS